MNNSNKKRISTIICLMFLAATVISSNIKSTEALETAIISQTSWDPASVVYLDINHPSASATLKSGAYETFKTETSSLYLTSVIVRYCTSVQALDNVAWTAKLYSVTSQAYNSQPNTVLANSTDTFHFTGSMSNTSAAQLIEFNFDYYLMSANTYYAIGITVESGLSGAGTDYIRLMCSAAGTYAGYLGSYKGSAWAAGSTGYDLYIVINAEETLPTPTPAPATPTPTPTDDYKWDENTNSWTWWNGTHWIPSSGPSPTANAQIVTFTGNMINYIVPLCLLLLPAIVGAWALGRAGAAKWGFIAGLNIGAIMCYLYLPSFGLWAVIAIVLVDILMVFASQRGGD